MVQQIRIPAGEQTTLYGPIHALRVVAFGAGATIAYDRGPPQAVAGFSADSFPPDAAPIRAECIAGNVEPMVVEYSRVPRATLGGSIPRRPALRMPWGVHHAVTPPAVTTDVFDMATGLKFMVVTGGRFLLTVSGGGPILLGTVAALGGDFVPFVDGTQIEVEIPAGTELRAFGDGTAELHLVPMGAQA